MIDNLEEKGRKFRIKILQSIYSSGKGHIGGAYSCIDILTALYYGKILNINKENFLDEGRNRFLLSKGHAAIAQYVILQDLGLFGNKELMNMNNGGILGEHPDTNIPGIEFDSGSLGHGLGIAAGIAFGAKLDNKDFKTFVLMGDGECYEGTVWEAAMLASHLRLKNLIAIVDRNMLCIHGNTEKINALNPFSAKWESFGWNVKEINGHNYEEILKALTSGHKNKPTLIVANTIKGKGVSFMENNHKWHHGGINEDLYNSAYNELIGGVV